MTAEVTIKPITALAAQLTPEAANLILLIVNGVARRAALGDIRTAIAVATSLEKGLMSATDKESLDVVVTEIAKLLNPSSITIPSADTITVTGGRTMIVLTGTTPINNILGLTNNRPVYFYYPTGAGLTIKGESMKAGDSPLQLIQTA
jgi:hypothetical protein